MAGTGRTKEPDEALLGVRDALVVALAATSGYVDAVSYLGLGRVFTSNMTGNTVLLGLALAQAQPFAALRSLMALVGFLCGVAIATLVVERLGGRKGSALWPPQVTSAFTVEGAVLLAFAVGCLVAGTPASGLVSPLIVLSAVAMGMQSVAVRDLGVAGVTTTYITGTWTTLIGGLESTVLKRRRLGAQAAAAAETQAENIRRVQAAVVGVYVVAAIVGGLAENRLQLLAGVVPFVAMAVVVGVARRRFPQGE